MKTSAVSLLIAIAGFLQESKCMWLRGETIGTIMVTLGNHEFTGNVFKVTEDKPRWLIVEATKPFESYKVHFRGRSHGRHNAILREAPTTPGHKLNRVHLRIDNPDITIGSIELDSYDRPWQRYDYRNWWKIFMDCMSANEPDVVYISIPKTTEVYYVQLETPDAHRERIQREERERIQREEREHQMV